jgi:hypothetical protein
LGVAMEETRPELNEGPSLLDVVALLADVAAMALARGQVGTVVEQLDEGTLLVEFSDDQGCAYALAPLSTLRASGAALCTSSSLSPRG